MERASAFSDDDFCFACGSRNPLGLHLSFLRDGDELVTRVSPQQHWQGFAGVLHGGLQAAIMDDLMSNHLFRLKQVWVATGELTLRFRRPVPLDRELIFRSRVEHHAGQVWLMAGECSLADAPDGPPLTLAKAKFVEIAQPGSHSRLSATTFQEV